MGLRSRFKDRLTRFLADTPAPSASAAPQAAAATPVARSSAPLSTATPGPAAPGPAASPGRPEVKPVSPEEQAKQDKIAAHFEKARRGVLQQIADRGGTASMADLHDYSERRYFIAHQAFSRMMEGFVSEGLIDFDHRVGEATLSERGRAYLAG